MPNEHLIVSIWKTDRFASRIARIIDQKKIVPAVMQARNYRNEEFNPTFQPMDPDDLSKGFAAKNNHIYILGCFNPQYTPQELAMRMILAAKAAKDNGALTVTAVLPDMPYARADRSSTDDPRMMGGKSFSLEALAQGFAWNVDKVLTIHPHSEKVYPIFSKAYTKLQGREIDGGDIIYAVNPAPAIAHYFISSGMINKEDGGANAVFLAMDEGAVEFTNSVVEHTGLKKIQRVFCSKRREKANDPNFVSVTIEEDIDIFKGKDIFEPDDGIDTGGTVIRTNEQIPGAKSRNVYATHAWYSGNYPDDDAQDYLLSSNIDCIVLSNTHPDRKDTLNDNLLLSRIIFLDFTKFIADAMINCLAQGKKLENHYVFKDTDDLLQRAGRLYDVIDPREM